MKRKLAKTISHDYYPDTGKHIIIRYSNGKNTFFSNSTEVLSRGYWVGDQKYWQHRETLDDAFMLVQNLT